MATPKIAVVFYSTYGTNHAMAQIAVEAARAAGAEVRLRRCAETVSQEIIDGQNAWKAQLEKMQDIPEVSHDDMLWADGYMFSVPTRYGSPSSQVRAFIDTLGPLWQEGKLNDKTFSAMMSAQTSHGGHETTLWSLLVTAVHWGCILVTPGYADGVKFEDNGNPYGFSKRAGEVTEVEERSIRFQTERLVRTTGKLIA